MNSGVATGPFTSVALLFAAKPAQQPYLTGMVNIVKCYAPQFWQQFLPSRCSTELFYCKPQFAVLALEQLFVGDPRRFCIRARLRSHKKIAALQYKRTALASLDFSPYDVFPIRGVQRDFPDVVPATRRAPCCLLRGHSAERLPQIWTMPCSFFIGFVEQDKNEIGRVHGGFP